MSEANKELYLFQKLGKSYKPKKYRNQLLEDLNIKPIVADKAQGNTKTMFLPNDYKQPQGNSKYLRLTQGDNKFRILSDSIVGYVDWKEADGSRKPIRTKEIQPAFDQKKQPKHFWSFVVWDYADDSIKILELTQRTIQDAIIDLYKDDNWGDPKGFDITIKRTGEKMETKYSVIPTPPKDLSEEVETAYTEANINLEALFEGGDPFTQEEMNVENIQM